MYIYILYIYKYCTYVTRMCIHIYLTLHRSVLKTIFLDGNVCPQRTSCADRSCTRYAKGGNEAADSDLMPHSWLSLDGFQQAETLIISIYFVQMFWGIYYGFLAYTIVICFLTKNGDVSCLKTYTSVFVAQKLVMMKKHHRNQCFYKKIL